MMTVDADAADDDDVDEDDDDDDGYDHDRDGADDAVVGVHKEMCSATTYGVHNTSSTS